MDMLHMVKVLAIVTMVTGGVVMIGWIFDIDTLKSILPIWVTMKFTTALNFLLSGLVLYSLAVLDASESAVAQILLQIASLMIVLLMGTLLVSTFLGIRSGVEDLFVKETESAIKTTTPGQPSVGTMVNFLLIVSAGLYKMFNPQKNATQLLMNLGRIIVVVGGAAIMGYIVGVPVLYYTLQGYSSAMAFHTALLFILLGVGMTLFKRREQSHDH